MNELALFAGAGGGILGGLLCGFRTVCAVEIEPAARAILMRRQDDGSLEPFPIWDDVRTFDGKPWRGLVDVVTGGFPCQDIAVCGNGIGIDGDRSGLWSEHRRIIGEVRPRFAFVENSSMLVGRGLARVLGDLAKMGYDARWGVMGGSAVGSCVEGERLWIVAAKANGFGRKTLRSIPTCFTSSAASSQRQFSRAIGATWDEETDTRMRGDSDALARGMDRLRAIGNGQDPLLAAFAWQLLSQMNKELADR
jgi:DNA (cytosine-5)-methyltransferase 1